MNQGQNVQAQAQSNMQAMARYQNLKKEMKALSKQRGEKKKDHDKIEGEAIKAMLAANKRYIQLGDRMFAVIGKQKQESNLNKEKYDEYFGRLYDAISQNAIPRDNPNTFTKGCVDLLKAYLSQYEKRKLKLDFKQFVRKKTCEDLKQWMDEAPNKL